MKYTPWKHALAVVANSPNVYVVTNGKWGAPNIAIVDNEANARLIAAAPEMLEFIRKLTGYHNALPEDVLTICNEARALLAKVEKEEK